MAHKLRGAKNAGQDNPEVFFDSWFSVFSKRARLEGKIKRGYMQTWCRPRALIAVLP